MIKIYLLDFSGAEADKKYLSALSEYVTKTKNPTLRRERLFAYMLLDHASLECFGEPACAIERDENGRPRFSSGKVDFNLSHDGEMAALVISDEGRVGIDIQKVGASVSRRLTDRTDRIFSEAGLSELPKIESLADMCLLSYSEGGGILKSESSISHDAANGVIPDFFRKWTLIEALSKADGRGLALFSEIDFSNEKFLCQEAAVKDRNGDFYALAVCKKQN